MSNLNNIEKMLQFATIEQMYKLLQSMKTDVCNSEENINLNNNTNDNHSQSINSKMFKELNDRVDNIHNKLDTILNYITVVTDANAKNQILLSSLASELNMNLAQNRLRKLDEKQSSQQLMTDFYAPAVKGSQLDSETPESANQQLHLEIKEKDTETTDEEVCDDDDDNPALITCSSITTNVKSEVYDEVVLIGGLEFEVEVEVKKTVTVLDEEDEELSVGEELGEHEETNLEEVKENNEEELAEEVKENNEEVEEESEEEVGTDEEVEEESAKEEEKQSVNNQSNEEKKDEEEEEELELFEIEIDDVTYFATDEENGDLYEMDKDGDVGKKVGIIKDGEPIFN